jgi:phosphoribosylaminoimidazole-succinocarboxamide synthase
MNNVLSATSFSFERQTNFYKGKVRDVYTIDNKTLVMVATDRISAFDVVLPRAIPYKGQVLNQIAARFLALTADIVPNWVEAVPDPVVTIGKMCDPFKVEMVIRGYLSGHAWREYKNGKRILCGVRPPLAMMKTFQNRRF